MTQVDGQESPSRVLPSSQVSPNCVKPSPQTGGVYVQSAWQNRGSAGRRSHCSLPSTIPLPQSDPPPTVVEVVDEVLLLVVVGTASVVLVVEDVLVVGTGSVLLLVEDVLVVVEAAAEETVTVQLISPIWTGRPRESLANVTWQGKSAAEAAGPR